MSAQQDIARLLQQWLDFTQAEAGAIESSAWPALKEIQAAKSKLQRPLTDAMGKWTAQSPENSSNHPFRAEVNQLIALEARNSERLSAQASRTRLRQESQANAVRNLRNVHRSYGRKPAAGWESYS
jgi:hypothetical protein